MMSCAASRLVIRCGRVSDSQTTAGSSRAAKCSRSWVLRATKTSWLAKSTSRADIAPSSRCGPTGRWSELAQAIPEEQQKLIFSGVPIAEEGLLDSELAHWVGSGGICPCRSLISLQGQSKSHRG